MNIKLAYNTWAEIYDTNDNKTRDLEKLALIDNLKGFQFESCLEIGCGTGKNTEFLLTKSNTVLGIDLSEEMLAKAMAKILSERAQFQQADISEDWTFVQGNYELITFSLMLEHIENLEDVIKKAAASLKQGGLIYIGELHPFKQYAGCKARFETTEGIQVVTCFTHHISEFTDSSAKNGLEILRIEEYFDDNNRTNIPRILTLLLRKR